MQNLFRHGYALLVGVGQSQYTPWSLPVSVNDALGLKSVLCDMNRCAYPDTADHVRVLHDDTATRAEILAGLEWLAQCAERDRDATVVVFFSGHGWRDTQANSYFLVPSDIDPLDIPGSALSGEQFTAALRAVDARRLLVVLDCCHAGGMTSSKERASSLVTPPGLQVSAPPKALVDNLKQGQGRAVFSSSTGEELSWIEPSGRLSLYTRLLIEALEGAGSQSDDTDIRLSTVMGYLGKTVPQAAQALGRQQTPFFDQAAEDFPIALLFGGKGLQAAGQTPTAHASSQPQPTVNNRATHGGRVINTHGSSTFNDYSDTYIDSGNTQDRKS